MSQEPQGYGVPPQPANPGPTPPYPYADYAGTVPSSTGYPSSAAATRPRRGWIVAIVIVLALLVATLFGMWSCTQALSGSSASPADLLTSDAVGVIDIDGTIQYDGTTCSPEGLKRQLDVAADDDHIVAVVLRVNSGGGTATAGEEMATYVRQFKQDTGKPVVVSSAATNASAAYEISSQADYIYTAKTTSIGAIGTAMQMINYSDLLKMLGISIDDITSSPSKDSTYGTRPLTDEERAYYQDRVNEINEVFIQNVADGRGMSVDEVRTLATGLSFTGATAVENGLADEIGTQEDAVAHAANLANSQTTATVALADPPSSDLTSLLGLMSQSSSDISADELAQALKELKSDGAIAH